VAWLTAPDSMSLPGGGRERTCPQGRTKVKPRAKRPDRKPVSGPNRIVCPLCELGEMDVLGQSRARCRWCDATLSGSFLGELQTIAALPEVRGKHACEECGHPEMKFLPDGTFHCPACGSEVLPLPSRLQGLSRLVFSTTVGTPVDAQNVIYRHFKPLLKRAGLPDMRWHYLRHTCATLLLTRGVHPKIVQELLGYSHIAITLATYSHVLPGMGDAAAGAMDEAPCCSSVAVKGLRLRNLSLQFFSLFAALY
jgi:hypothetical protein